MKRKETAETALQAKNRVAKGLDALRVGLSPYVARRMSSRYGRQWRHYASRAGGGDRTGELDLYALLKTLLALWRELFSDDAKLRKARSYISLSMDARNSIAHFTGQMSAREAIRYLDAMRELALAVGAGGQVKLIGALYDEQLAAQGGDQHRAPRQLPLGEPPVPARLRPWREVCEPHPDVLSARFSDAEFAANLALVDLGEGSEEYVDPAAFFRITYATEGITRVLTASLARMAGKGGDPVIGLQTNFGGGKTHTMLALHHLAGAAEAGYGPQQLAGMTPIFEAAGCRHAWPRTPCRVRRHPQGGGRGDARREWSRDPHPLGIPCLAARRLGGGRPHRRFRGGAHQPRLGTADPDPSPRRALYCPDGRGRGVRTSTSRP